MSDSPRHSVSVAAAIFDDSGENVLLIKRRDNGRWEPPGGVLELEETIEDGLRREVREETGAEIQVGPLTGVYKNMAGGIVALVFAARSATEPQSDTAEAFAVRWVPLSEIDGLMTPAYSTRIRDALGSHAGRPTVRSHDGRNLLPRSTMGDRT
ncbi:NUDIX hydrolase [Phycicoccus sp. M110.8]|uniref:NUDIX hydrolase n=1 Tax=Phycicoccus sp. M110.8 TaxID=3075433 RepID=UPI0028FD7D5C|nr:NUDIX hydrolase [Phycicoccus sp. M110.8]MDU0313181.1 NUDIX hydrolase [Phycicoccus sp. M110.8]